MNTEPIKSFFRSKTVWVQAVAVLSTMLPVVAEWLQSNPVSFVAALAALNVLVRFFTHGKISLFSDGNTKGVSNLLIVAVALGTALGCGSLVSCSTDRVTWDLNSDPYDGEPRGAVSGMTKRMTADGGAKNVIDSATVLTWMERVALLWAAKEGREPVRVPPPVQPAK